MVEEEIRGFQGEDPYHLGKYNVAACIKHYFAYGAPFTGKDRTPAYVSPQMLREKYFDKADENTPGAVFLTTAEIRTKLTIYGSLKKEIDSRRLGAILKRQGYTPKRNVHTGARGYILRERTEVEIQQLREPSAAVADIADIADINS